MTRKTIELKELRVSPFTVLDKDWMLLTAGDYAAKDFNSMTVSWGSIGTIWNRPLVMVVVRPTRHTFKFIEKYDTFTVCAFPAEFKKALDYMGSKSGRDGDKAKATGLTPMKACKVAAPAYEQADLVMECRKIYFNDLDPANFLLPDTSKLYNNDYHRMYFGEVLSVSAADRYIGK